MVAAAERRTAGPSAEGCARVKPMNQVRLLFLAVLCAVVAACGGSGGEAPAPPQQGAVSFVFRLRGLPDAEEFRVSSTSPAFIAEARAQLVLPPAQRTLFVAGPIAAGNGGHNSGWSWHFSSVSLVEAAIELCDGTPSMVEADLSYWLDTVKTFCPWSSYAYAEVQ